MNKILKGALIASAAILAIMVLATSGGIEFHLFGSDHTAKADEATATSADPAKCVEHEVHANETYDVPAGCNVKGDVSVKDKSGQYVVKFDTGTGSELTGLIVSCPKGCTIKAPYGANVTPDTVDTLKAAMLKDGCDKQQGCKKVDVFVVEDGPAAKAGTTPAASTTAAPVDKCDPSLGKGEKMLVPVGCVVSGDVSTGPSETGPWHFEGKGVNTDGTIVVVKTAPIWVFAPYGASVTGANPDDVKATMMQVGCGFSTGCKTVTVVTK